MQSVYYRTAKKILEGHFGYSTILVLDGDDFNMTATEDNPANDFSLPLSAGSNDELLVKASDDKTVIYVLSVNRKLTYVGLQTFSFNRKEQKFEQDEYEFFAQESDVSETLGEDWEDYNNSEILEQILGLI